MQETNQSETLQSAAAVPLSCRYWGLNDPYCCIHLSRDFQCFSMSRTTLQNCPFPWEILTPIRYMVPWVYKSQPPKRHLDRSAVFAQHVCVTNTQTDTRTTLRATSVALRRISTAMRPINNNMHVISRLSLCSKGRLINVKIGILSSSFTMAADTQ